MAEARLLVVCLGNICRSPMAEGLLRARVEASPLAGRVDLDSAGTGDWHVGAPPDPRAVACARGHGVEIEHLRGRHLALSDYHEFDWLLCADRHNLRDVRIRAPRTCRARPALLLDWAGVGEDMEIPDPYTGGPAHFERVWTLLERAAEGTVARLTHELG